MKKVLEDFPGYYIYPTSEVENISTNHFLKPQKNGNGYLYFHLTKNKKRFKIYQHRLVALAHLPNPDNKPIINHIDSNKENNHLSNLEWVTYRENTTHSFLERPNTSKYIGVSWHNKTSKWTTRIMFKGKYLFLGYHLTEDEARYARINFEKSNNIYNKYV